jgi:hypothetical protein
VSYAPQSSPGLPRLPAWFIPLFLFAAPLVAQEEKPLVAPTDLQREPDGTPLVSLPAGAPVEPGRTEGDWHQVTVEGWISTSSTAPTRREGFDLVVTPDKGENLRSSPNGPIVGRAREGTLLERVGARGKWTRVRRKGWVPRQAVAPPVARQARTPAEATQARQREATPVQARAVQSAQASSKPAPPDAVETTRATQLSAAPGGAQYGSLQGGIPARVVGHSGEWTQVEVSGWVRESDLQPAQGGAFAGVSAAEVRAAPDRFVGQTLDWKVQLIAVQNADELRTEMAPGQPYLLTRGPLPEPGFVYVTIPADSVAKFRALPPLSELTLRLRLKAAKTRYLTTPVAEYVGVVEK